MMHGFPTTSRAFDGLYAEALEGAGSDRSGLTRSGACAPRPRPARHPAPRPRAPARAAGYGCRSARVEYESSRSSAAGMFVRPSEVFLPSASRVFISNSI